MGAGQNGHKQCFICFERVLIIDESREIDVFATEVLYSRNRFILTLGFF